MNNQTQNQNDYLASKYNKSGVSQDDFDELVVLVRQLEARVQSLEQQLEEVKQTNEEQQDQIDNYLTEVNTDELVDKIDELEHFKNEFFNAFNIANDNYALFNEILNNIKNIKDMFGTDIFDNIQDFFRWGNFDWINRILNIDWEAYLKLEDWLNFDPTDLDPQKLVETAIRQLIESSFEEAKKYGWENHIMWARIERELMLYVTHTKLVDYTYRFVKYNDDVWIGNGPVHTWKIVRSESGGDFGIGEVPQRPNPDINDILVSHGELQSTLNDVAQLKEQMPVVQTDIVNIKEDLLAINQDAELVSQEIENIKNTYTTKLYVDGYMNQTLTTVNDLSQIVQNAQDGVVVRLDRAEVNILDLQNFSYTKTEVDQMFQDYPQQEPMQLIVGRIGDIEEQLVSIDARVTDNTGRLNNVDLIDWDAYALTSNLNALSSRTDLLEQQTQNLNTRLLLVEGADISDAYYTKSQIDSLLQPLATSANVHATYATKEVVQLHYTKLEELERYVLDDNGVVAMAIDRVNAHDTRITVLENAVDALDFYTKAQSDAMFLVVNTTISGIVDRVTILETSVGALNFYTKAQSDAMFLVVNTTISGIVDRVTIVETTVGALDFFTKAQINTMLETYTPLATFIVSRDALLSAINNNTTRIALLEAVDIKEEYFNKQQITDLLMLYLSKHEGVLIYYTKTDSDAMFAPIDDERFDNIVYANELVPYMKTSDADAKYSTLIQYNGHTGIIQDLFNTVNTFQSTLTNNYYTKIDSDNKYVLFTTLAQYYNAAQIDNMLGQYQQSIDTSVFVTTTQLQTMLQNYMTNDMTSAFLTIYGAQQEFASLADMTSAQSNITTLLAYKTTSNTRIIGCENRLNIIEAEGVPVEILQESLGVVLAPINQSISGFNNYITSNNTAVTGLQDSVSTLTSQVATANQNVATMQQQVLTIQGYAELVPGLQNQINDRVEKWQYDAHRSSMLVDINSLLAESASVAYVNQQVLQVSQRVDVLEAAVPSEPIITQTALQTALQNYADFTYLSNIYASKSYVDTAVDTRVTPATLNSALQIYATQGDLAIYTTLTDFNAFKDNAESVMNVFNSNMTDLLSTRTYMRVGFMRCPDIAASYALPHTIATKGAIISAQYIYSNTTGKNVSVIDMVWDACPNGDYFYPVFILKDLKQGSTSGGTNALPSAYRYLGTYAEPCLIRGSLTKTGCKVAIAETVDYWTTELTITVILLANFDPQTHGMDALVSGDEALVGASTYQ